MLINNPILLPPPGTRHGGDVKLLSAAGMLGVARRVAVCWGSVAKGERGGGRGREYVSASYGYLAFIIFQ